MGDRIPITLRLSGQIAPVTTRMVSASAHVLVLTTTIVNAQAPYSLHSAYVGQRGEPTAATHLLLAPGASEAELSQRRHEPYEMPVADDGRHLCLYDHLQVLLAALHSGGHDPRIDVADHSVALVDR